MISSVRIVGSGLIGTSIGLALSAAGIGCDMVDHDARAQSLAQDLVGPYNGETIDLVICATPPSAMNQYLSREFALNPQAIFMDVGSVKAKPQLSVEASTIPMTRFCFTHPMAGREMGGPESARGDLFHSRAWVFDPSGIDSDVRASVLSVIETCGAVPIEMANAQHDRAVALISHLPQLLASLIAKQLIGADESTLGLAGAGLRDTTRIAGSDPDLWSDIITSNSQALKVVLEKLEGDLRFVIEHLDDKESIRDIIAAGKEGRSLIPGKHGGKARAYTYVPIVIDDRPGQLHRILNECADLQVNIEDLSIEHSPGQEKGLVTLAMSHDDAQKFSLHMKEKGWSVHPWRS